MRKKVSVVVVSYNGERFLPHLLNSLKSQSYPLEEIILVDNASQDNSLQILKKYFPHVKVLKNSYNMLYGPAMNRGISLSRGDYLLCLNHDLYLDKYFVEYLLKAMDTHPRIGMACGKVLSWDGQYIDSCGQTLSLSRKPVDIGFGERDREKFDRKRYVWGPGGVAPLFKRVMLEEIKEGENYFDEELGIFYEDLDLAWRASRKGWRCIFEPKAIAYHFRGGATLGMNYPRYRRPLFLGLPYSLKERVVINRYYTLVKNEELINLFLYSPFIFSYDLKLWLVLFAESPWGSLKVLYKTWKSIKNAFRKRKIYG